jgi:hypothetical protein
MAASAGLLVYGIAAAISAGWMSLVNVGVFAAVLLVAFAFTRSDSAAAVVMLPVLVVTVLLTRTDLPTMGLIVATAVYIWLVQVSIARQWLAERNEASRGHARG